MKRKAKKIISFLILLFLVIKVIFGVNLTETYSYSQAKLSSYLSVVKTECSIENINLGNDYLRQINLDLITSDFDKSIVKFIFLTNISKISNFYHNKIPDCREYIKIIIQGQLHGSSYKGTFVANI